MIEKIRTYFIAEKIVDESNRINIEFLGLEPTQFSIEKIASNPILEKYINGSSLRQFQFRLVSCEDYGPEIAQNISNNEFYENFYSKIEKNNKAKKLPKIDGIVGIECLDDGAIINAETNTARYSILMRITYIKT